MKKSVDILGLPVISINEGNELGKAKALVINPAQGAIEAIAIDDNEWYMGAKLLPFSAVAGLGEYAITADTSNSLVTVANAPDWQKFLAADIKVIGAKVVSKAGGIQGKVTEIIIDEAGKIVSCEVENNGEVAHIPAQRVMTYGKDVLIVSDTDLAPSEKPADAPVVTPAPAPTPEVPAAHISPKVSHAASASTDNNSDDSAKKFDDKQRKYLLGKKATRRIDTDNGVVIVEQGGEITEEVIQKAKLAGKFVELSMSI